MFYYFLLLQLLQLAALNSQSKMEDGNTTDKNLASNKTGKEEKKKWPRYCKTMMVTDSHGTVKELVFPKALDLDRPKRERTTFSVEQLDRLEEEFRLNQYLVGKDRTSLADSLGLSETQVKVWFQNRRTKHKKDRDKRVEDGDHQAESQAAQNVLKLLEYKTAFGFSPVLGGTTGTNSVHNVYEPADLSNSRRLQQVAPGPSSTEFNLKEASPCSTNTNCAVPLHVDGEANWLLLRAHSQKRSSAPCHISTLPQRPYLTKTVNLSSNKEKRLAPTDGDLRQHRHSSPEVINSNQPLLQHPRTAYIPSELLRSDLLSMNSFKSPPENRFLSPYHDTADATFPTIHNRPFLRDKHVFLDHSNRNLSYPLIVSGANHTPANFLPSPQFHSVVHPSLPTPHSNFGAQQVLRTLPLELSHMSGHSTLQPFSEPPKYF